MTKKTKEGILKKYEVKETRKKGVYGFTVGDLRLTYGWMSKIDLYGIKIPLKDRLRVIYNSSHLLQMLKVGGKWKRAFRCLLDGNFNPKELEQVLDGKRSL